LDNSINAINDVVLVVLKTPEILEPVGITQEKFFTKVLGYDETDLWVQFPDFELPVRVGEDSNLWIPESIQKVNASAPSCISRTSRVTTSPARSIVISGSVAKPRIRRNLPAFHDVSCENV
jgi:hypothetical protein